MHELRRDLDELERRDQIIRGAQSPNVGARRATRENVQTKPAQPADSGIAPGEPAPNAQPGPRLVRGQALHQLQLRLILHRHLTP